MSQGSQPAGSTLCTCIVQRLSENIERIVKMCEPCQKDFNPRHAASVAERAEARAQMVAEEAVRARA